MRRALAAVAAVVALVACGGAYDVEPAQAGNPTKVKVITDWSEDDEGFRVVEVKVGEYTSTCIQAKDKYGGGFESSPKGVSIALSCKVP